jgi:ribonuclease Z
LIASDLMAPDGKPSYIFHITPPEVLESAQYSKWAAMHGPDAIHIVANSSACPNQIAFHSASVNAQMLHFLSPRFFRAPAFSHKAQLPTIGDVSPGHIVAAEPLTRFHLDPPRLAGQIDRSSRIPLFEPHVHTQAASELFALPASVQPDSELDCIQGPLEVSFMGTGSMMPSKYRNVSGIHVQLAPGAGIILDPGEGTVGQMGRCWSDLGQILVELKMVWVSHMHADHHLGTISVRHSTTTCLIMYLDR